MPDRAPALAVPLLLLSLLLAAGLWFAGLPALACAWLAPVPATLGVSLLRGHRSRDGLLDSQRSSLATNCSARL